MYMPTFYHIALTTGTGRTIQYICGEVALYKNEKVFVINSRISFTSGPNVSKRTSMERVAVNIDATLAWTKLTPYFQQPSIHLFLFQTTMDKNGIRLISLRLVLASSI